MKRYLAVLTVAATSMGASMTFAEDSQEAKSETVKFEVNVDYLVYLPKDYEEKESFPLLLFLHGAGERGNDLDLVKKHGPPKLIAQGKEFPFIVISPQCPKDSWWNPVYLDGFVTQLMQKYKVDSQRVYVTGLSMGGFGTWALAAQNPKRYAAIAPICGGGEPIWNRLLADMPVWVFHGAKDFVVPLERSQVMVDALKGRNDNVKFTVYPEAGHDSWTETYDNPDLYEWFLKHERKAESR